MLRGRGKNALDKLRELGVSGEVVFGVSGVGGWCVSGDLCERDLARNQLFSIFADTKKKEWKKQE